MQSGWNISLPRFSEDETLTREFVRSDLPELPEADLAPVHPRPAPRPSALRSSASRPPTRPARRLPQPSLPPARPQLRSLPELWTPAPPAPLPPLAPLPSFPRAAALPPIAQPPAPRASLPPIAPPPSAPPPSMAALPPIAPPPSAPAPLAPAATRFEAFPEAPPAAREPSSPTLVAPLSARQVEVTREMPQPRRVEATCTPASIPPITVDTVPGRRATPDDTQPAQSMRHATANALRPLLRYPAGLGAIAGFVLFLSVWLLAQPSAAVAEPAVQSTTRSNPTTSDDVYATTNVPAPTPQYVPTLTYAQPSFAQPAYAQPGTVQPQYATGQAAIQQPAPTTQPAAPTTEQAPISPTQLPLAEPPAETTTTPSPIGAPSRTVAGFGTINLNSIPISNVVLDGRPLGPTPQTGVRVKAGTHNITFIHPTQGRRSTSITVGAGQNRAAFARFSSGDE